MPNAEAMTYKLQQIPVADIRPGPNVRQAVDPSELVWLADSLKVRQQQPLLVDADHVLIDGYRRWLAAQRAELKWLWAIVTNRPLSKTERTEAQLVMDLHRKDFTDAEKVAACEALLGADLTLDQKRLAEKLQVDPATVSRWLSVSADRVIPEVRAAFDDGRIKLMLAHAISQAPHEAQAELLQLALRGASRAQVQTRVRQAVRPAALGSSKRLRCLLPDGVSVTLSGPALAIDDIIEHFQTLLRSARKARDQNLDAKSWEQSLGRSTKSTPTQAGPSGEA